MTDSAPGPGWWLASDGNWYPPHLHPDVRDLEPEVDRGRAVDHTDSHAVDHTEESSSFDPAWFDTPPSDPLSAAAVTDASGSIDWEAVAAERAARRDAVQKSPNGKRTAIAAVAAVLALGGIAAFAQNSNDDNGGRVSTATTTTISPTTTSPDATGPTGEDNSGATRVPGQISVFDLAPGACIDQSDLTEGLVTTVQEVPCDQPHTHEVYLTTSVVPANVAYDAATVTAFANQECTAGFDQYVGIAYNDSKFYFLHLAPSEESWLKDGDRDVVCLLLLDGEKLTQSVKGTAQ